MATGDFGSGRMPPDMFLNCNEEIKRKKGQTIRNWNMLISRDRIRAGGRDRARESLLVYLRVASHVPVTVACWAFPCS